MRKFNTTPSPEWARSKALPPQSPWPSFPFFLSFLSCLSSLFYPSSPFFPGELNKNSQGNRWGKDTRADTYKTEADIRDCWKLYISSATKVLSCWFWRCRLSKKGTGVPLAKRQMQQAGLMHKGFQSIKGTKPCAKANVMMPHKADRVRFNIDILASSISSSLSCSNGWQISYS